MAIKGSSPVNVNLGMLDTRPAIQANAMVQQANVNLANSVNQAVNNFVQAKEKKENEQISINAIQSILGISDPNLAKAIVKDPAVRNAFQFQREQEQIMNLAKLEAAQTPGFTTGIDLESTGQFLLPPTEENPAGEVVLGGFATDGNLAGSAGYFTGERDSRRFEIFPEGTRQYSSAETDKVRNQLIDISNDLQEEQQGITALKNYYETRAGTPKGLEFLFLDISRKFSTLLNQTLTADQVKTGLREGQFQGLLGRIRLDVLGGGVLTEQDARRLEKALGGSGVASDPAVVKKVIGDIIRGKQVKETELINNYNRFLTIDPFVYNIFKDTKKEPIDVGNIFDPTPVNDEPKTLAEAEQRAIKLGLPAFKFGGKTYKTPTQ